MTYLTYNGDHQVTSITDAEGDTTSFTYVDKLIRTVTHPGGGVETIKAQFGRALEDIIKTADVKAEYKNELNNTWYILFNRFGSALSITDPQGQVTTYTYNSENLVTSITEPDPDGNPDSTYPQIEPQTVFTYDSRRNLTGIEYPDTTEELWTYEEDFNQVTEYINRRGKITTFEIDENNGNTLSMLQVNAGGSNNSVWEFTYTTTGIKGLLASVTDPLDHVTIYDWLASGLLSSITYADGTADVAEESFSYDAYENLETFTDGLGRETDYTWDLLDRLTTVTLPDPDGAGSLARPVYTYEYNKNNYLKKETDPLGHFTEYSYNGRLDLVQVKQPDPDGGGSQGIPTTTLAYDAHRRLTSVTDPLSRVTAYAYDTLDRNTGITLPDPDGGGSQTSSAYAYGYDHIGRVIQVTDPLNNVTLLDHSTWNQIEYTLPDPDGLGGEGPATMLDAWNAEGDWTGHTDELDYDSGAAYDDLGRLASYSLPGGVTTYFGYDKASNVTSVTNPRGYVTAYEYDARNRVVEMTEADPDGAGPLESPVWSYTYNDANELTSMTDPRGYTTTYTYDGMGRLITVTEPDPDGGGSQTSPVTTYAYDAASRLTNVTDPLGNVTGYTYDNMDRLISVTEADPDGGGSQTSPVTSFTYDAVGNLLTVTDPLSRVTTYTYDGLDRLTSVAEPSPGGTTSYGYDKVNNLLSVTDALNHTTTYEYNNRYFLIELTQPAVAAGTPVWTYTVDAAGRALEVEDPLERVTALTYDGLDRILTVTRPYPDGAGSQEAPEISYGYDANSNLVSLTDARGNETNWVYDRLDRLTQIKRPQATGEGTPTGPTTSYAYDAAGNLTSVTDPLSRVTSYAYDGLNRRTSVTQPDPDGEGSQTSPVTSFGYDTASNVVSITDPRGNVTTRALDHLYRATSITQPDPDGGGSMTSPVTSFTYDAAGQMLSMTDPMSRLTSYEYNGLGLNTKITEPDPDGAGSLSRPETTFTYDAMRHLLSVTDPLSHTTEYTYDNLYRNTRITDANDGETDFTYDKVGNLLTLTDPVENTTTWTYDALNRAVEEENQLGFSRLYVYDAADNLVEKADRNARVTEYDYDNLNRLVEELWVDVPAPEPSLTISTTTQGDTTDEVQRVGVSVMGMGFVGGTFTLTYSGQTTTGIVYNDSASAVQTALEALSNIGVGDVSVTKYANSSTSQVWEITFTGALADTNVSQITINSAGVTVQGMKVDVQQTITAGGAITYEVQTTTLANANGGTYTLSFEGQTTAAIAWNATAAQVDGALEALSTIDTVNVSGSSGCYSITFTGTHSGQNVPQLSGDDSNLENHQNRALSFTYDAADQLTAAEDPAASYEYVYDNLGRVTQQTQDLAGLTPNIVFNQAFDAASNRTELTATIGSNTDFKNTYTYDNLNRMTQVIQQSNSGNAVAAKRVDFTYNASGQFDVISRYQSTGTTAPVATTTYGHDGMGRLTDLDHKTNGGATTLAAYDYTFDAASRITSVTSSIDGLSSFTYDVTNQLTAADHASQPDETYTFDLNGNRTMSGYEIGDNNQLLSDGTYDYAYDNEGNRISRTNISTDELTEYEWDHRNRLVKVTEKDDMGAVTSTTENTYDVFDRWIRRSYDVDGEGSGTAADTFFAYDGNQLVLQFEGDDDDDLSNRYLWGPDVDQFFTDEQVTSLSSAGNVLWGLADHQGSLRDIADRNESTGVTTVSNHREYHAFGALTGETNSAVDLIFGYTGRLFDETTGLQDNWHRPYDSITGNWPSNDPRGFGADDANLSRYVFNHATSLTDPTGLEPGYFPPNAPPEVRRIMQDKLQGKLKDKPKPHDLSGKEWRRIDPKTQKKVRLITVNGKDLLDAGVSSEEVANLKALQYQYYGETLEEISRALGLDPSSTCIQFTHIVNVKRSEIAYELRIYTDKTKKVWYGIPLYAEVMINGKKEYVEIGMQFWNDRDLLINDLEWYEPIKYGGELIMQVAATFGGAKLGGSSTPITASVYVTRGVLAFQTGADGEAYLVRILQATKQQTQIQIRTGVGPGSTCLRRIDVLQSAVAHESKVGYVKWSTDAWTQIKKDAWLLENDRRVRRVIWHFFRSANTGEIGADPRILDELRKRGIEIIIHE